MYRTFESKNGKLLISTALLNDVDALAGKIMPNLNHQRNADAVHCFVYDLFDEDEQESHGCYDEETLCKMGVIIFNSRLFLFDDPEQAAEDFNKEDCPLKLGFDKGTFYPQGTGNWYGEREFVFISDEELSA